VTELTPPLPAKIDEASPRLARAPQQHSPATPSFPELVYAHFAWWHALRGHGDAGLATAAYRDALAHFGRQHGEIVNSYWCSHVESAVALTEQRRRMRVPRLRFHRETDWATRNHSDIASELHRCDELAVRATTVLNGVRQRICLQLVMASAAHLLSLVDARAAHEDDAKSAEAVDKERVLLNRTERYYCDAANGQAQIVYFGGMVTVAAVISVIAALWLTISWAAAVAALIAGAAGAVVSVIQRINAGQFELAYDVGRPYAFFLGGLRPLIGGAFAVAVAFAFTSGILHLPLAESASENDQRLAVIVVSFLAGFSERWAQDTLATALPAGSPRDAPPAAAGPGPEGQP